MNRPEFIQVNIAIIDTSPRLPLPVLYVLKRDLWDADLAMPNEGLSRAIGRDPLVPKGPVLMSDRPQKRLYLLDNSVLVYNHLVSFTSPNHVSSSKDPRDSISHGAVSTLMDALRCLPIRPQDLDLPQPGMQPAPSAARYRVAEPSDTSSDLECLKRLKSGCEAEASTTQLCSSDRWLFEVQT